MAFREVRVFEVREVLRVWLGGPGFQTIERLVGEVQQWDDIAIRRPVALVVSDFVGLETWACPAGGSISDRPETRPTATPTGAADPM
jgi:hypothetical protein